MIVSRRAAGVTPSATLSITATAKKMVADGLDVVSFAAGEPDFDTPAHIKAAAEQALKDGRTGYTPAAGLPALRQAVADHLAEVYGFTYEPAQIVLTCGAKYALYETFQAVVNPGDEVIVPTPYWVTYPEQVRLAGGIPVFAETDAADGFRLHADAVADRVTGRTAALVVNSPCNPTGAVCDAEEMAAIARLAVERDFVIIADEIYAQLVYDGAVHVSPAALGPEVYERTVTINGLSKAYAMTGWRVGYAAAPAEIADAIARIQSHTTSNVTTFGQYGAMAALTGDQSCVAEMAAAFARRRRLIVDGLNDIDGVTCPTPYGAFYAFPEVGDLYGRAIAGAEVTDSMGFARLCLERAHVALIPGGAFGADRHVRLSYAASDEAIEKGLARLKALIENGTAVA